MKRIGSLCILVALSACATLGQGSDRERTRTQLWADAHDALQALQFGRADTLFTRLSREFADTETGRESLFFVGAIRVDPRNPGWDPARADTTLSAYLALESAAAAQIGRRPEAETLLEIARQLNLPPQERVPQLQPETRFVTRAPRVAPAGQVTALNAEVARLRDQVAARDATIRRQEEELERIRRTLAAPGR